MKGIIGMFIGATLLASCSSYEPVADLRASKDAHLFQRDVYECERLALDAGGWYDWFPLQAKSDYSVMVDRCLKGRGHSIISANRT